MVAAVDPEATEVRVAPIEEDRDDVMELGQGAFTPVQDASPDHGTDLADPDVELVDERNHLAGHDPSQRTQGRPR
jgi:hypothetical protein